MKSKATRRKGRPRGALDAPGLFRALADATYDWETWMSTRGRLLWVNPAVERVTGYTVDECMRMQGYPLPLVHPDDRKKMAEVLAAARAGTAGNDIEMRVLRKDGTAHWVAISWQAFRGPDGRRQGYRTSVRDIQERKLAEERLQSALALVEQAAVARNEFLANMSHELRTPLQCILGYAQLLRERESSPERAQPLDLISSQTEHLLALIGDVLDMAALQVASPELFLEDFDLRAKLESVIAACAPNAREGVTLRLEVAADVPARVRSDRMRLRQIVTNLVGNALKFTESGHVTVRARLLADEPGLVPMVLEVEDTGIGIAPEAVGQVFEPFVQGDATIARRYGGTGLGLPIARRLCEALGGRLTVESTFGVGACFRAHLPLAPASGQAADPEPAPSPLAPPLSGLRVLVVDDGPAVRELMCDMLRAIGVSALSASSGREALSIAKERPLDLVLMDLQMPDLDGLTAAQLIRAQQTPGAGRPMIVALTADAFGRALALGPSGGMDGFLVKPVRMSDLRSLVSRCAVPRATSTAPRASPIVARPSPRVPDLLDGRVLRDLQETRGTGGRTLLEITGRRVLDDTELLLIACQRAALAHDSVTAAQTAHRIKGNCLVIGATHAATLAQALDDAAQRGDWAGLGTTTQAFSQAFSQVRKALEALISLASQ